MLLLIPFKVSYSCMNNVESVITRYNARRNMENQPQSKDADSCNCIGIRTHVPTKKCKTKPKDI